jgi:hypothetical protein
MDGLPLGQRRRVGNTLEKASRTSTIREQNLTLIWKPSGNSSGSVRTGGTRDPVLEPKYISGACWVLPHGNKVLHGNVNDWVVEKMTGASFQAMLVYVGGLRCRCGFLFASLGLFTN